jgi:hypothetical protein
MKFQTIVSNPDEFGRSTFSRLKLFGEKSLIDSYLNLLRKIIYTQVKVPRVRGLIVNGQINYFECIDSSEHKIIDLIDRLRAIKISPSTPDQELIFDKKVKGHLKAKDIFGKIVEDDDAEEILITLNEEKPLKLTLDIGRETSAHISSGVYNNGNKDFIAVSKSFTPVEAFG